MSKRQLRNSDDIGQEKYEKGLSMLAGCGIITAEEEEDLQKYFSMRERKNLLREHPYDIYRGKDGKWYTYVVVDDKRKKIKRSTKEDVEDVVIKYLKVERAVIIDDIFNEFMERKIKIDKLKPSSCDTYRQVYERHYVSTGWNKKNIKKLSAEDFTDFLETECAKHNLPQRSFGNLKTITKGILKRASRSHLIDYTYSVVFDDIDIRPKKKKCTAEEQIFTEKELSALLNYLSNPKNWDVQNLALLFMILSGIRVGEMVALAFNDFISDTGAKICRTEIKYRKNGKYVYDLSEPKTDAGIRTVFIPDCYAWIVKEMRSITPLATYLCTNKKGERMTTNCLRRRLERICEKLDFEKTKSTHKLRKTFCSIILDHGFDNNLVTSIMGHVDVKTSEQYYHFDRKSNQKKQEMVNDILEFRAV